LDRGFQPEDSLYLIAETQRIKNDILEKLRLLSCKLPSEEVDWLTAVCDSTLSGVRFDDSSFNRAIELCIQKGQSKRHQSNMEKK
jgi:hypothetical protein